MKHGIYYKKSLCVIRQFFNCYHFKTTDCVDLCQVPQINYTCLLVAFNVVKLIPYLLAYFKIFLLVVNAL